MSHRWRYIVVEPRVRMHCVYNIKWAEMRGRGRSVAISESLQGGWKVRQKGLARFVWFDGYLDQPVVRGYRVRSYLAICSLLLTRCTTNLHTAKYKRPSFRCRRCTALLHCLPRIPRRTRSPLVLAKIATIARKKDAIPRLMRSASSFTGTCVSWINLVRSIVFYRYPFSTLSICSKYTIEIRFSTIKGKNFFFARTTVRGNDTPIYKRINPFILSSSYRRQSDNGLIGNNGATFVDTFVKKYMVPRRKTWKKSSIYLKV